MTFWVYKKYLDNIQSYCSLENKETIITVSCYMSSFCCCFTYAKNKVGRFRIPYCSCAFSEVTPDIVGKHFGGTAVWRKGLVFWLKCILHIKADLALLVSHSLMVFAFNCSRQVSLYKLSPIFHLMHSF